MHIIAGEHNLTITKQTVYRDNGVGLILEMEVARDSIAIGDLETIVQDIADNAFGIEVFNDEGEKVQILSGFHCEPNIIAKGATYTVEFINASENTYQIGRQQLRIEDLEKEAVVQSERSAALEEISAVQVGAIESILLEVIPSTINEAVAQAMANMAEH